MKMILAISAGGAIGALMRHYLAHYVTQLAGSGFPWGILAVNVIGSFIMGVLVDVFALAWSASQEMRALLTVGILGSLTTFSTFALNTVDLMNRGEAIKAGLYVSVSVAASVGALMAGMALARAMLA